MQQGETLLSRPALLFACIGVKQGFVPVSIDKEQGGISPSIIIITSYDVSSFACLA